MFDPAQGEAVARELLNNPETPAADLATIAGVFPALAPQIAAHPNLYPGLADWIKALGDPEADAALAARDTAAPAAAPATQEPAAQAQPQAQTPAQPAQPAAQPVQAPAQTPYQPPMASGPQQPQQPQQPQAPYGAGYQGYQPYPGPGAPSGTQQVPEAKKGGKGKLIGIIAAALVVVLVAAGAGWFFFLRDGGGGGATASDYIAPDFKDEPKLGDEIEADEVLEGDYGEVDFGPFVDANHVLVIGSPDTSSLYAYEDTAVSDWYEGYDEDYDRGWDDGTAYLEAETEWWDCYDDCGDYPVPEQYFDGDYYTEDGYYVGFWDAYDEYGYGSNRAEEPEDIEPVEVASAVALLNLDSAKLEWTVDLVEKTGFDMPSVLATDVTDNGYVGLRISDVGNDDYVLLAISPEGEVVGTRDSGYLLMAVGEYFLWQDDDEVSAVKGSDFENEVWTLDANPNPLADGYGYSSAVLEIDDSTTCVLVEDGCADLATGDVRDWGDDAGDEAWYVALGDGVVLRFEESSSTTGSVMRIDPKTGEDKWDSPVKKVSGLNCVLVGGKVILERSSKVVAVDAGSGEEKWTAKADDLTLIHAMGNGNVVVVDGYDGGEADYAILKAKDGEEVRTVNGWPLPSAWGSDLFYAIDDDNELVAYDLTGDSKKALWKLDLDVVDGYAYVTAYKGRLWAQITETDYDGPNTYIMREVIK
ncbi:MAG: PQQ-like beta-propeller repeat protein [Bifidobacteriaceae bacterium]|jgi:hypothetical protein|nr:PQQ-like beta-propeller repeat protein [Bifidobacteriaceae bacterium]